MKRIPEETLIDALSSIDEKYLAEYYDTKVRTAKKAENRKEKHNSRTVRPVVKWAAALAAVCVLFAAVFAAVKVIGNMSSSFGGIFPTSARFGKLDNTYPKDAMVELHNGDAPSDIKVVYAESLGDWQGYTTADDLVQACTLIVSGKLVDISFEIVNEKTGYIDNSYSTDEEFNNDRWLYTVYTVEVENCYLGDAPKQIRFVYPSGMKGYKEQEQIKLFTESGIAFASRWSRDDGTVCIPVCVETAASISIGKEYLFCLWYGGGDFNMVINPYQYAFDPDSDNAKMIIASCKKDVYKINYDITRDVSHDVSHVFEVAPGCAKAGAKVRLRTVTLCDGDYHVFVDGVELERDSPEYNIYSFTMPEREVTITVKPYTKQEIWGD